MSFTPTEIAAEVKKHIPESITMLWTGLRQKNVDSWLLV
jgi:hypothetical protein